MRKKKVSAVSELLISFELHEKKLQRTKTISMNAFRSKYFLNVLKNGDSGNIMKTLNRLLSIENTFVKERYALAFVLKHFDIECS